MTSRVKEIDVLRGFASVAVMLYHFTWQYFAEFSKNGGLNYFKYGNLGVELFFIISGFVIYWTAQKSNKIKH